MQCKGSYIVFFSYGELCNKAMANDSIGTTHAGVLADPATNQPYFYTSLVDASDVKTLEYKRRVYGDAVDFGNAFGNQEEVGLAFLSWSKALQMTWLDDSRRMEYVWHFAMMFPEQGSELTSALMANSSGEK